MAFTVTLTSSESSFFPVAALIFDKDGTLENSRRYLEYLTQARLQQLAIYAPDSIPILARAMGWNEYQGLDNKGLMAVGTRRDNLVAAATFLALAGYGWFEALELAQTCFDQADRQVVANAETCPTFPGVKDSVAHWHGMGMKIAIVSAARQGSVERFITDHHLENFIQAALGSDQGLSKPDPALYHQICHQLGVNPQETLMIGDAQGDITMAKQAGSLGAIAITWPGYGTVSLTGADGWIESLEELRVTGVGISSPD